MPHVQNIENSELPEGQLSPAIAARSAKSSRQSSRRPSIKSGSAISPQSSQPIMIDKQSSTIVLKQIVSTSPLGKNSPAFDGSRTLGR